MQKDEPNLTKKWWQREDSWALLIGSFLLLFGVGFFAWIAPTDLAEQHQNWNRKLAFAQKAPIKNLDYWKAYDQQEAIRLAKLPQARWLQKATARPGSWTTNPLQALFPADPSQEVRARAAATQQTADSLQQLALLREKQAELAGYTDLVANDVAIQAIADWRAAKATAQGWKKKASPSLFGLGWCLLFAGVLFLLFLPAARFMRVAPLLYLQGFALVFGLALVSYLLGANVIAKTYGIGYAAWALLLGLLISNTVGLSARLQSALQPTLYIKTGLILLGAEVLFTKIMAIGLPGIFVAWVVTPVVLLSSYWFGQRILRISSKTLNITIAADMSVCGVSAAVATAAACGAKKEELTLAVGLSMVFTSVMMIVMPLFIHAVGMPEVLGGAWIGGTIDATGAVVAAGAFLGDTALNVAATIKMIQNILIGLIAFGVAVYFSRLQTDAGGQRPRVGLSEIWRRFPKFILGFIGASLIFSALYAYLGDDVAYSAIDQGVIGGFTKNVRGWLFAFAFVGIGLSTNFKSLRTELKGGKPLLLYVCGQSLNLLLTLLMAYLMFYVVFPNLTAQL